MQLFIECDSFIRVAVAAANSTFINLLELSCDCFIGALIVQFQDVETGTIGQLK